eukprot:358729-Chlamydomonas_euryale.AAC.4
MSNLSLLGALWGAAGASVRLLGQLVPPFVCSGSCCRFLDPVLRKRHHQCVARKCGIDPVWTRTLHRGCHACAARPPVSRAVRCHLRSSGSSSRSRSSRSRRGRIKELSPVAAAESVRTRKRVSSTAAADAPRWKVAARARARGFSSPSEAFLGRHDRIPPSIPVAHPPRAARAVAPRPIRRVLVVSSGLQPCADGDGGGAAGWLRRGGGRSGGVARGLLGEALPLCAAAAASKQARAAAPAAAPRKRHAPRRRRAAPASGVPSASKRRAVGGRRRCGRGLGARAGVSVMAGE